MITPGDRVRLTVSIIDEDFNLPKGTIGTVDYMTVDKMTNKPMFVVKFFDGRCGVFPDEIEPLEPLARGVWL